MKWLAKLSDKSFKVTLPERIVSNVAFNAQVDDTTLNLKWMESTKTLLVLKTTDDGVTIESPIAIKNMKVSQFAGDPEKDLNIELSGAHGVNIKAKTSRYIEGQEHRDSAKAAKGSLIRSPITGKVLKVNVCEGDEVSAGDSLLTIEAMKMENKIFATTSGEVAKINVKPLDMVSVGQELVSVKA